MSRYYKRPMLLIEFDDDIPFRLNDYAVSDMTAGGDINPTSLISKLTLLTLHFPNLQIIWSKSPAHTADIFKELKKSSNGFAKDPDLQKIAKIGKVGDSELDNYDNEDDDFNRFIPTEFLKKLPGIDSNNIIEVTKKIKNMTELCEISEEKLRLIIGPKNAKELKTFLETKIEI